ncbi:MAG: hypothetical protein K2H38_05820 [Muribaculaceae bacterium]|nr:hypothetical protein [Muribaculaceae bacterium]
MTKSIFSWVAESLLLIGKKTGLTYNEVNVIVYYLIIPLSWTIMLDCWLHTFYFTAALILIWVGILLATRNIFREWCDWVFKDSVDFLNWFNRWGGNYELNSVIICVVLPLIVYGFLIYLLI